MELRQENQRLKMESMELIVRLTNLATQVNAQQVEEEEEEKKANGGDVELELENATLKGLIEQHKLFIRAVLGVPPPPEVREDAASLACEIMAQTLESADIEVLRLLNASQRRDGGFTPPRVVTFPWGSVLYSVQARSDGGRCIRLDSRFPKHSGLDARGFRDAVEAIWLHDKSFERVFGGPDNAQVDYNVLMGVPDLPDMKAVHMIERVKANAGEPGDAEPKRYDWVLLSRSSQRGIALSTLWRPGLSELPELHSTSSSPKSSVSPPSSPNVDSPFALSPVSVAPAKRWEDIADADPVRIGVAECFTGLRTTSQHSEPALNAHGETGERMTCETFCEAMHFYEDGDRVAGVYIASYPHNFRFGRLGFAAEFVDASGDPNPVLLVPLNLFFAELSERCASAARPTRPLCPVIS